MGLEIGSSSAKKWKPELIQTIVPENSAVKGIFNLIFNLDGTII
jgi:hypothetical protein